MSEHGPQPDHPPLPLEVEQQIDRVSREFESAWKSEKVATHRGLRGRVPVAGRSRLLEELLMVEFESATGRKSAAGCGLLSAAVSR